MAVKVLNRKYTTPFKPASQVNWMLGNVGDWQKLSLLCEFAIEKVFDITNTVTISDPNVLILNDGTTWGSNGFAIGMFCTLHYDVYNFGSSTNYPNNPTFYIGNIIGNRLEAVDALGNPFTTWGFQYGQIAPIRTANEEVRNVYVYSDDRPQGIEVTYTHLSNNQAPSGSLNSFLDGTKTVLLAENTDTLALFTPTEFDYYLSFQSGMSIEYATVEYRGNTGYKKNYLIEIIFMLSPFGEILNFLNNDPPSVVKGTASITDNFEIKGFPVYNNPNVTIKNNPRDTVLLGNVGWFNENYNQLPNNFTFTPVVYENLSATVVDSLDYANPIKMTTTISGINNLSGLTRFQFGFIWLPLDEDLFKQVATPFHQNCKVSTGGQAATLNDFFPLSPLNNSPFPLLRTGYSIDSATMDTSDISFVQNGSDVDVSITFRPSVAFAAYMDTLTELERRYAIWVSVGDQAPDTNSSDRVSLLLDFNTLNTFIEPIGEYDGLTIEFTDHPQDYTDTPRVLGNVIYVEDDLLAKVSFQIDTATGADIPIPTKIAFGFLAENTTTGQQYYLDNNSVDLTQYPDPTQFNFSQSRGFKLNTTNDKNWFKVEHDPLNDSGTLKGVLGWYGFKIRWEDWIKRFPLPPTDFYDNTEAQNGQNNDWFHYYNTSGWNFYFFVNITATLNGQTVVYQNLKDVNILDYDVNPIITTELKYYRDNAGVKGALLSAGTDPISGLPLGVIIDGEYVWLDIEYTRSVGTWLTVVNSYGVNCIEVDGGAGQFSFRQLSSVWLGEFDNPQEPIPGQTLAILTLVSPTKLRVSTRINANKLIDANRYKVTGRLGAI